MDITRGRDRHAPPEDVEIVLSESAVLLETGDVDDFKFPCLNRGRSGGAECLPVRPDRIEPRLISGSGANADLAGAGRPVTSPRRKATSNYLGLWKWEEGPLDTNDRGQSQDDEVNAQPVESAARCDSLIMLLTLIQFRMRYCIWGLYPATQAMSAKRSR